MFSPQTPIGHAGLFALCVSAPPCHAQDIEPRRWSQNVMSKDARTILESILSQTNTIQ